MVLSNPVALDRKSHSEITERNATFRYPERVDKDRVM
jgi:hypothetical protein